MTDSSTDIYKKSIIRRNANMQAMRLVFILGMVLLCSQACHNTQINMGRQIDIQGHRGCRGLMPENTIPAFLKALDLGVNTLELDVVVNRDGHVIVSHEPFFNHEIATAPDGSAITVDNEQTHNLYPISVEEIQTYDVGLKKHPRFPLQKKIQVPKPQLSEMVAACEAYALAQGIDAPLYNIEIKRVPEQDGIYHPEMKIFADTVCEEITRLGIMERTTVQCFDVQTLQYIHESRPAVKLVYLVENTESFNENIDTLGFIPAVYSPYYEFVDKMLVQQCHQANMKLIPWTVNEAKDIEAMIILGVDGIISDYPDRVVEIVESHQKSQD